MRSDAGDAARTVEGVPESRASAGATARVGEGGGR
jgi:hypothetical protein